jgi:hypothetical protein
MIYVDKMGTSANIREEDILYDNREGLFRMGTFYELAAEVFNNVFGTDNYYFFGFSDAVIAVTEEAKSELVAKAASKLLCKLTENNIPVRIYITRGDFAYHKLQGEVSKTKGQVCPIYGTTLLDAYEMDCSSIRCIGVFLHEKAINDMKIIGKDVVTKKNFNIGLLDLESYLEIEEIEQLKNNVSKKLSVPTIEKLEEVLNNSCWGVCNKKLIKLIEEKFPISKEEIEQIMRVPFEKEIKNTETTIEYYRNLYNALTKRTVVLK